MSKKESIYTPKEAPKKKSNTTPLARALALFLAGLMVLGGMVTGLYYIFGADKISEAPTEYICMK